MRSKAKQPPPVMSDEERAERHLGNLQLVERLEDTFDPAKQIMNARHDVSCGYLYSQRVVTLEELLANEHAKIRQTVVPDTGKQPVHILTLCGSGCYMRSQKALIPHRPSQKA